MLVEDAEMADKKLGTAKVVTGCIKAVASCGDYTCTCCINCSAKFQAACGDNSDIVECEYLLTPRY